MKYALSGPFTSATGCGIPQGHGERIHEEMETAHPNCHGLSYQCIVTFVLSPGVFANDSVDLVRYPLHRTAQLFNW